jgi:hypothetical protein
MRKGTSQQEAKSILAILAILAAWAWGVPSRFPEVVNAG